MVELDTEKQDRRRLQVLERKLRNITEGLKGTLAEDLLQASAAPVNALDSGKSTQDPNPLNQTYKTYFAAKESAERFSLEPTRILATERVDAIVAGEAARA